MNRQLLRFYHDPRSLAFEAVYSLLIASGLGAACISFLSVSEVTGSSTGTLLGLPKAHPSLLSLSLAFTFLLLNLSPHKHHVSQSRKAVMEFEASMPLSTRAICVHRCFVYILSASVQLILASAVLIASARIFAPAVSSQELGLLAANTVNLLGLIVLTATLRECVPLLPDRLKWTLSLVPSLFAIPVVWWGSEIFPWFGLLGLSAFLLGLARLPTTGHPMTNPAPSGGVGIVERYLRPSKRPQGVFHLSLRSLVSTPNALLSFGAQFALFPFLIMFWPATFPVFLTWISFWIWNEAQRIRRILVFVDPLPISRMPAFAGLCVPAVVCSLLSMSIGYWTSRSDSATGRFVSFHCLRDSTVPKRCAMEVTSAWWKVTLEDPETLRAPGNLDPIVASWQFGPLTFYNPYETGFQSDSTIAGQQLSRAFEDQFGLIISPKELEAQYLKEDILTRGLSTYGQPELRPRRNLPTLTLYWLLVLLTYIVSLNIFLKRWARPPRRHFRFWSDIGSYSVFAVIFFLGLDINHRDIAHTGEQPFVSPMLNTLRLAYQSHTAVCFAFGLSLLGFAFLRVLRKITHVELTP
jgi:hypothetical protein